MRLFFRLFFTGAMLLTTALAAPAADLKLEVKLIWGTNDDTDKSKHKAVDSDLARNLQRMFKWKNYVEITNQTALIALNKTSDLKMSGHCTLKIKNLGGSRVEINCIGNGKQVSKGTHTLPPTWLVLGGNAENDSAWFIALRSPNATPVATTKN